ncbi:MAG: beta-galactosidase [Candidatus Nanopelagicales bacterium]
MNAPSADLAIPRLPEIGFGGDWNPEQWPASVWDEDLGLMVEAGVNLVTVGVFSWALLEPRPGEYDFGWMDTVLDKCLAAGVRVDLATATASPPPWLGHRWPETLPVTVDGTRLAYGARQQYCPSSPVFRERALALTGRVAARYADHDAVVMWHVGNEYGAHTPACWCDVSAEAFRDWLAKRYGTLDELNDAWSTAFWSQRFCDWAEVIPPRRTPYFPNPTHQLDFRRFSSDAMLELFASECDLIRGTSPPDKPITTNFMRFFPHADYWEWAAAEDVVSDDWYPDPADPTSHLEGAAGADLMRSLGRGRPWLLMEQAVSAINWRAVNPAKSSAEYRRWSLQQVARGADAVLHFQWRAAVGGAEKWHSAMLPHAGPRTRSWRAVVGLGGELADLRGLAGARTPAPVVFVLDWESWWALELDSRPSTQLSMVDILMEWYAPLWRRGYSIDFAHPESDLTAYGLVIVPQLYSVTDSGARQIAESAERGATVAIGYFSGAVDERDRVRAGGYPAAWQDLLGLWVEEYRPLPIGATAEVSPGQGDAAGGLRSGLAHAWTEHVHLAGAQAMMEYSQGELAGCPAVTRHALAGGGRAWYVSADLDPECMDALVLGIASDAEVRPILAAVPPPDVEVAIRETPDQRYLFLLNHASVPRTVDPTLAAGEATWRRVGGGEPETGPVIIPGGDVVILVAYRERTSGPR